MPIFPRLPGRVGPDEQFSPSDLSGRNPVSGGENPLDDPLVLPTPSVIPSATPQPLPRRALDEEPKFPIQVLPNGRIDESQLRLGNIYVAPYGTGWRWQGRRFVSTGSTRRSLSFAQMSKRALGLGPTAVRLGPDEMQNRADLIAQPNLTRGDFEPHSFDSFEKKPFDGLPGGFAPSEQQPPTVLGQNPSASVQTFDQLDEIERAIRGGEQNTGDISEVKTTSETNITGKIGKVSLPDFDIRWKGVTICSLVKPKTRFVSADPEISNAKFSLAGPEPGEVSNFDMHIDSEDPELAPLVQEALLDETSICFLYDVAGSVTVPVICEERSNDSEKRLIDRWQREITVRAEIPDTVYVDIGTIFPGWAGFYWGLTKASRVAGRGIEYIKKSIEFIEILQSEAVQLIKQRGLDAICTLSGSQR